MTFEYVNKLQQLGRTSYDLIITNDSGVYPVRVSFLDEDDTEESRAARAEAAALAIEDALARERVKDSIKSKVEAGKNFMLSYVESHPDITLQQFAAINSLVNQALQPVGIVLDQPNLQAILKARIEDSIAKIQAELSVMYHSEELEQKVDTALATILGAMQ